MEWIQKGSKGDEVLDVQKRLQAKGFDPGPIDGIFGSKTEAAVRAFQQKHNLQVDGIVGPKTGGALGMLKDEAAEARFERMNRGADMKAKTRTVTPDKAKTASKAGSGKDSMAAKRAEAEAEAKKKSDAEEAAEKVGGSLWSRITGRNKR